MASLFDRPHYVPGAEMLQVEISTPYHEVQRLTSERQQGGFVVTDHGRPRWYVKAAPLAEVLVSKAAGMAGGLERVSILPVGEVLELSVSQSAAPMLPVDTAVDMGADPSPLQNQDDAVFLVTRKGKPVGFFLNHETLRETLTHRVWFLCTNHHRNPDPDHGTCYHCPFPIVGTEVEAL